MKQKQRLDKAVQSLFPELSRQFIQSLIMQGKVIVNDKVVTKAGTQVSGDDVINITKTDDQYVSRAGYKLAHALSHFQIDVSGLIALDAGISTGGFTDCLLQNNIARVHGIDVGYGQTVHKIRSDPRVILHERVNVRHITKETIGEMVDLVTLDLSFISVLKVLDAVKSVLKPQGMLIVLVKPQFEGRKDQIGAGGIVRDDIARQEIVNNVIQGIAEKDFLLQGACESPITGTDGNREFLAYFRN
jgi:23S rRNA (cytidine1920-2'-O)/16S rRNA (cytidine1409-2'-O)-methyltransferase